MAQSNLSRPLSLKGPILLVACSALLLAACDRQPEPQETPQATVPPATDPMATDPMAPEAGAMTDAGPGKTMAFNCPDGTKFIAHFTTDKVDLMLPDRTVTLSQEVSASGARYSDTETTFWTKGPEATLTVPGKKEQICTEATETMPESIPPAAP